MRGKSHIDEYVKAKLSERRHVFQPEHWEMAQALLVDQQKRKRRRFLIWFWLGLGSLPILLVAALILWPSPKLNNQEESPHTLASYHLDSVGHKQEGMQTAADLPPSLNGERDRERNGKLEANQASEPLSSSHDTDKGKSKESRQGHDKSLAVSRMDKEGKRKSLNAAGVLPVVERAEAGPIELSDLYKLKKRSFGIPIFLHFEPDSLERFLDPFSHKKHSFGLEWGGNLNQAFGSIPSDISVYPLLGFRYGYALRPGLKLLTGLRFSSMGGLNVDSTFRGREFGFGLEETRVTRSPRVAHQVEIPLGLQMRLWKRHYLQLGGQANYLLDVSGREITRIGTEFEEMPVGEEQVMGLRQGFRRTNAGVFAGYGYYLGKGSLFQVQFSYNFWDMSEEAFFQHSRLDRPWSVRVMFSHDLWRK